MADLGLDGKAMKTPVEDKSAAHTHTHTQKKKPVDPPEGGVKKGISYERGNFDVTVITILAQINMNIVAQTDIIREEFKKLRDKNG